MNFPSHTFRDAGASVVVTLDARSSTGQVQVQVTGDSLTVVAHRDAKRVVLFDLQQLYSTVDASAVDWEDKDGQITVKLEKLDPSLEWPQLEATKREADQRSEGNPLEDREQVKALLSAAQSGDVEAFKAAGQLFPAGQLDGIKDANGRNALHFAAASSNADICSFLAREQGFSLDATDESGEHAPFSWCQRHMMTCGSPGCRCEELSRGCRRDSPGSSRWGGWSELHAGLARGWSKPHALRAWCTTAPAPCCIIRRDAGCT